MRRNNLIRRRSLAAGLVLAICAACDSPTGLDRSYPIPQQTGDGIETASLADVGLDPVPLLALVDLISTTPNHGIHSLLVFRTGKLVVEEYWPGVDLDPETLAPMERFFDRETLHYVASVSKSVTSLLAGISIDLGMVDGVDDSLFHYFPEYADLKTEENAGVRLEHLLSFTSGLEWNEFVYGFGDPRDSHYKMFHTQDPIGYLLGRASTSAPGERFHYNSGDTNLLGEVVRSASRAQTLTGFAEDHLLAPLGIQRYGWLRFGLAPEVTFASGGVSLRPRDMGKLGLLMLNGGTWNGVRVVSQGWVDQSTRPAIYFSTPHPTLYGYGYNWWLGRFPFGGELVDYSVAMGWGEQLVYVIPRFEMVIVLTGGQYYTDAPLDVDDLITAFILEAIVA